MEELALRQPALIGRDAELTKLKQYLDDAIAGKGSTIFIAGEAGIGKTRLASELFNAAISKNAQIIPCRCLLESLEPLMPIKTALRESGLFHLISGDPPPLLVSAYLTNEAGLPIAKAEREELGLDPDIFGSMLTAVGSFVRDSMRLVEQDERPGGLNILGYKEYKILIEQSGGLSLAAVIKGSMSEFLVGDMKNALADVHTNFDNILKGWDGDLGKVSGIKPIISRLITSGKYDGKFLVDDPRIRQENVFDNVLLGVQRLSADRPLLLFLDDLQWADPSTLSLVNYLARNTRSDKVLIVGDYRPEDIVQQSDGKPHQLDVVMQNMTREDLLGKIELTRLDRAGTEELVNTTLGKSSFSPDLYEKIYKETEGTPFFVLEVVKLLAEEGWIKQDDSGTWTATTGLDKMDIPSKVYDVVKRRLDRLKKDQREILDCASVVGEEFRTDIVGKTMDLNKLALLKNLSDIEKTHKLIHSMEKKFRFDHAKVRAVLYDEIIDELKVEYHRLVADSIAELHKDDPESVLSELAMHYYKAKDEKAGEYLIKAAEAAKEKYANEEAIRFYNYALEVVDDKEMRKRAHEQLGDIHKLISEPDKALENYQNAIKFETNLERKAGLHCKIAKTYGSQDKRDAMQDECEKGLALLNGEDCVEVARLLGTKGDGIYCNSRDSWNQRREIYYAELQMALKIQDNREIARAHNNLGGMYFAYSDEPLDKQYKEALLHFETALKLREEIGDEIEISDTLAEIGLLFHNRGNAMWGESDNWNKAIQYYNKSLAIKKKIGDKNVISFIMLGIGILNRNRDDLIQAQKCYEESLQISLKGGIKSQTWQVIWFYGELCELQGEVEKALSYYSQSYQIALKIGIEDIIESSLSSIGHLHINLGEVDKAFEYYKIGLNQIESKHKENSDEKSFLLTCIGMAHKQKGELNQAVKLLQKSLNVSLEKRDNWELLEIYIGLAEVYLEMGNIHEAFANAEKVLETSKLRDTNWEAIRSNQIFGMVFREKKEWEQAIECFEKVKKLLNDSPFGSYVHKQDRGKLFYEYGLLWKAKGDHAKARDHLEESLKLYQELNWKLWIDKCRDALEELPDA